MGDILKTLTDSLYDTVAKGLYENVHGRIKSGETAQLNGLDRESMPYIEKFFRNKRYKIERKGFSLLVTKP
jgi:hypothetical protein